MSTRRLRGSWPSSVRSAGRIIKRVWSTPREVSAYAAGSRVDGFFVADPGDFETEFGALRGSLAKRIVGGLLVGNHPSLAPELGARLAGVVTGGWQGQPPTRADASRVARLPRGDGNQTFPGLDAQMGSPFAYYDDHGRQSSTALERVHGDLSGGERRFQAALAAVRLDSPLGPIHLRPKPWSAENYLGQFQRGPERPRSPTARSVSCRT